MTGGSNHVTSNRDPSPRDAAMRVTENVRPSSLGSTEPLLRMTVASRSGGHAPDGTTIASAWSNLRARRRSSPLCVLG